MNKNIFGIAVFIFSLLFGQAVFAHSEDNPWGCGERMKHMVKTLKLDTAQQAKIQAIKDQVKTNKKANKEQIKALQMQINQQALSDNMNQSKVSRLINTKAQLIKDMMMTKTMTQHQIYSILNAQQKIQFKQMHQQWEEKMQKKYESCHE